MNILEKVGQSRRVMVDGDEVADLVMGRVKVYDPPIPVVVIYPIQHTRFGQEALIRNAISAWTAKTQFDVVAIRVVCGGSEAVRREVMRLQQDYEFTGLVIQGMDCIGSTSTKQCIFIEEMNALGINVYLALDRVPRRH